MGREKGYLPRGRREGALLLMATTRMGVGEPGCRSHRCVWVQHQHKSQEGLAPLLSDPGFLPQEANLEAAMLGSMASWSPVSYSHSGTRAGVGHPNAVHINSRPFCTCVCACFSLSFWWYISN